jgi:hypothetical protein
MAIRNFLARRSTPKVIKCDNGTNFRSAEKILKKALEDLQLEKLPAVVDPYIPGHNKIEWQFNTPAVPNMGGPLGETCEVSQDSSLYNVKRKISQGGKSAQLSG